MNYNDYIQKAASKKVILAHIEPGQRLLLWSFVSGFTYKRSVSHYVIDVKQDSTSLTQVSSIPTLDGTWYFDYHNKELYVRLSGGVNPDLEYMSCIYRLFFSNSAFNLTHNLEAIGNYVEYDSILQSVSSFSEEVDSADQMGIALENGGSISLINRHGYFDSIFDRLIWENKAVRIYSWSPDIPEEESRLLFEGEIQDKGFDTSTVRFKVRDFIYKVSYFEPNR